MLIGGEWVDGGDGTYDIVNPATEQIVAPVPQASVADSAAACAAAADAFDEWSRTSPAHRAAILDAAADLWDERTEAIVPTVQAETGATIRVASQMQVPSVAHRLRRYARGALESNLLPAPPAEMPTTPLAPGGLIGGLARRQPVGVVTCITSYNFPAVNAAGKVGPALAMGNPVVIKPAPQDPIGVIELARVLHDAGCPPGVVNVVTTDQIPQSEELVANSAVDMISFTGSTGVGQRIGAVAGGSMKRLLLELGGKGACIVFEDADVDAACKGAMSTWAFHSGQICTSPTRLVVHSSKLDEVVGGLEMASGFLKVGDPLDSKTMVGPVITGTHRERVEGLIQTAVDEGGEVVVGGERPDMETGFYVVPTLINGVAPDSTIAQTEVFGPVISVISFDDEEEAISIANSTEFGLYDYIFSGDTERAMRVSRRLRTGNVGLNTVQRNGELPFGGFKQSGVGRDGGSYGLHAYSELQSVVWNG